MEISSKQLGDKVAEQVSRHSDDKYTRDLHVLQWGDKDVAQTDDLDCCQDPSTIRGGVLCIRSHASGALAASARGKCASKEPGC